MLIYNTYIYKYILYKFMFVQVRSLAYVFRHKVFMDAGAQKRFKIFKRKTRT